MPPPKPDARDLRRLSREIGTPAGEHMGLLLAVLLVAALALIAFGLAREHGPTTRAQGVVLGFETFQLRTGQRVFARVRLGDREGLVSLPPYVRCAPGDHIEVIIRRGWIGRHHRLGPRGCGRPPGG